MRPRGSVVVANSRYARLFQATPLERIDVIRKELPAACVIETSAAMGLSATQFLAMLRLKRSIRRYLKTNAVLPVEDSERIVGLQALIGQAEIMVAESGAPPRFNAAHWLANWLTQPLPALNNAKPAEFLDTMEGQKLVSRLLARLPSGAYA